MDVPPPTLCQDCRLLRRLTWRVERTLYFRTCDLTGQKTLSVFAPASPYKVYCYDAWQSDKWNALDYGRPFDFSRPFFEQFAELIKAVPLMALNAQGLQNCDYVNQCGWSKNCYLTIEADQNEDTLYGYRVFYVKSCVDNTEIVRSERCYECIDSENCFRLFWSQLCRQCSESAFLFDCRGCTYCFGCVGLRNKQYCIWNEQLSKEEYTARLAKLDLQDPTQLAEVKKKFEELKLQFPRKAFIGAMNENVDGNYIYESKDSHDSYNIRNCRDCRYCHMVRDSKDCMDYFVWGDSAEKIYESECCGHNIHNLRFCCDCWDGVHDLTYCYQCVRGTENCFGCVGVQRGRYCILNKQYTKEEYEELVPRIIEHMGGQYGEFFPANISPYSYNETTAQDFFPKTKDEVLEEGLSWRDNLPFTTGKETLTWDKIPASIEEVPDSITNEILACEATGRNFRIIKQELEFYREMELPLPRLHPDERHKRRMLMRNPNRTWDRMCMKCRTPIKTTYAPERPEKVYCEKCYLEAVY